MVTTIQLDEKVKDSLNKMKKEKETYEEVIIKMMRSLEEQNRKRKELLKEGYIEMNGESVKITKEFSEIDKDWD